MNRSTAEIVREYGPVPGIDNVRADTRRSSPPPVGSHEAQKRELRPRAEPHGRAPRPRAGTDVDPQAAAA